MWIKELKIEGSECKSWITSCSVPIKAFFLQNNQVKKKTKDSTKYATDWQAAEVSFGRSFDRCFSKESEWVFFFHPLKTVLRRSSNIMKEVSFKFVTLLLSFCKSNLCLFFRDHFFWLFFRQRLGQLHSLKLYWYWNFIVIFIIQPEPPVPFWTLLHHTMVIKLLSHRLTITLIETIDIFNTLWHLRKPTKSFSNFRLHHTTN